MPPNPTSGRSGYRLVRLAAALALLPAGAAAQEGDESAPSPGAMVLEAHRLESGDELRLDGLLGEAAWTAATPITDFTQVEPVEGARPTRATEIRVVYDEDALWIGAKLHDDPEEILAYQKRRDAGLGTDDRFMWILDTFRDGRTGYFFEINAAGLMGDGLLGGGGFFGVNKSWDGLWEARTAILPDGWSAEIRIPFSTLNFDPGSERWGINFQRTIRRRNEEIRWTGWRRNQSLTEPVHAGELAGLRGVSQGLGLEVVPYAVQNWRTDTGEVDPTSYPGDVGFDVGYSVTPSLRAAVSVNTDFAEVEVDERRVNLTRFPLRFPERRDFFLEGSGVYSFAPRSGPSPYFSRRIGLLEREPVPIDFGARLGGQAGPFELGFLHVATSGRDVADPEPGAPDRLGSEDFTVARVKAAVLERSTVGAIYTRRATASVEDFAPPDRHTAGVDLDYATSRLFGDDNFEVEAFLAWNSDADPDDDPGLGDLTARGFRFNYPNDLWQAHLSYREFGRAYDPAVGFVTRNDFRRVEPRVAWRPRPALSWVRQLGFSGQFRYLEGLGDGAVEERTWELGLLEVDFESGDRLELQATHLYEFLDDGFEVSDGVGVAPGAYRNWEYELSARSTGRRPVSGDVRVSHGGFWNGERTGYSLGLTGRPRPGVSLSVDYDRNEVDLPDGAFSTNLFRVNPRWDVSPWASLNGSIQYDDVSEVLGVFGLLRWIVQPGNEVYLVYTHNWLRRWIDPAGEVVDPELAADPDILDRRFSTLTRGGSVKVTYTFRW